MIIKRIWVKLGKGTRDEKLAVMISVVSMRLMTYRYVFLWLLDVNTSV